MMRPWIRGTLVMAIEIVLLAIIAAGWSP